MPADQKTLDYLTALWNYIQSVPVGAPTLRPFADAYPDLRDALTEARRDRDEARAVFRDAIHMMAHIARAAGFDPDDPTVEPPAIVARVERLRAERDALQARLDAIAGPVEGVDVEEVLRLDAAATPGPWYASRDQEPVRVVAGVDGVPAYRLPGQTWIAGHEAGGRSVALIEANAALIATYRDAAPALAREVVALRAINAQQRANAEGTNRVLRDQEDEIARLRTALTAAEQEAETLRCALATAYIDLAALGIAPGDGRPRTLTIPLTPDLSALIDRVAALGWVQPALTTGVGMLSWLVEELEEARLTLAAERGEPEGAPSDDWKRISGTWQRDYPDGSFATVFPSGNWFQGKFGDRAEYKGKAPTQRAAMLAADAVKP